MSFAYQPLLAASAALQAGGSAYTLAADAGSTAIAGQNAQGIRARRLTADHGVTSFSGRDVLLARSLRLSPDAGSVALSGQQASFHNGLSISAEAGNISVSGLSTSLALARKLTANQAVFSLSGEDLAISGPTRIFAAGYGGFGVTGQSAEPSAGRYFQAGNALIGISASEINIMVDAGTVPPSAALNFSLSLSL